MSRTRGQRERLRRIVYRIALAMLAALLLLALALVVHLWLEIEKYQEANEGRLSAPIVTIDPFGIPEERMGDYEAACQRYIEENHLEIQPFRGDAGTVPGTMP